MWLRVDDLRSRMRATSSPASGLVASSMSRIRKYSCRERPERAARAASSSLVSSGTSRTVIAVLIACSMAAMLLFCQQTPREHSEPRPTKSEADLAIRTGSSLPGEDDEAKCFEIAVAPEDLGDS